MSKYYNLSPREEEVVNFIFSFIKRSGVMPMTQQWSKHFKFKAAYANHLNGRLVEKGILNKLGYNNYMLNENMPEYARKMFNEQE